MGKMLRHKQCSEQERMVAVQRLLNGERAQDICHDFRISDASLYMWRKRFIAEGLIEGVMMKAQKHVHDDFGDEQSEPVRPTQYYTQKMYLAAALILQGKVMEDVLDTVPRKTMVFSNDNDIQMIIDSYFDGSMTVSAKEFYTAMCEIKKQLFGPCV